MIETSKYLHYDINAGPNNVIEVSFDMPWVNVLLMDEYNYRNYKRGKAYSYFGGLAESSPFNLRPPKYSNWHLVIDRGGKELQSGVYLNVV